MTVYLSRVKINPARRSAQRLLASLQRIHATVLASYPDPPTGDVDGPRILWRLDHDGPHTWLYVAGPGRPDFGHVIDQAGWPVSDQGWQTQEYGHLLGRLGAGQQWRFRLTASPTHTVRIRDGEPDTKRRPLLSVASRESWLSDRAGRLGFEIVTARSETGEDLGPHLAVTNSDVKRFPRQSGSDPGGRPRRDGVTISRTQYDGVLQVTDPAPLREALVRGIGPAKSYGCGLMTLAAV